MFGGAAIHTGAVSLVLIYAALAHWNAGAYHASWREIKATFELNPADG